MERPELRRDVAKWLEIAESTLRSWDLRFREYLEADVGEWKKSTRKRYTENDLKVFATIARLRDEGLAMADVSASLDEALKHTILDFSEPPPADADEQPAGTSSTALMTVQQELIETRLSLAREMGSREEIEKERDRLIEQLADADEAHQERIQALQKELDNLRERAAAAEAEAKILKDGGFLRRWFRRSGD